MNVPTSLSNPPNDYSTFVKLHIPRPLSLSIAVPRAASATLLADEQRPSLPPTNLLPVSNAPFSAAAAFGASRPSSSGSKGVKDVVSGYAGGHMENPTYEQICVATPATPRSCRSSLIPKVISFEKLLEVFWRRTIRRRSTARATTSATSIARSSLRERRAESRGGEIESRRAKGLQGPDRHADRAAQEVLHGRGCTTRITSTKTAARIPIARP